ncbi:MAG TPA: electron transfer flavoprotein subunit beta/FixA family protein [Longimicrobiales bacterium]|nr:electron transfer flavoprotein subunit beta/FixA family protein [Longimicrobiales bacterium]
MKTAICIKRVPDTEARIRVAADGKSIDQSGLKYVVSPYDEFAVEAALRLKDATGEGETVSVSLGGAPAGEQLRATLAMGVDRAIRLDGEGSMDGLAVARALAAELKALAPDLILCGTKAADDDQHQVGPMLAELLGLPCVTVVAELEMDGERLVCHREGESGTEIVEVDLPAVVTITKGPHEPRYPSLKGIMAAKKKPLDEKPAQGAASRVKVRRYSEPPPRPEGKIVGEGAEAVPELVRLLREEAKVL